MVYFNGWCQIRSLHGTGSLLRRPSFSAPVANRFDGYCTDVQGDQRGSGLVPDARKMDRNVLSGIVVGDGTSYTVG